MKTLVITSDIPHQNFELLKPLNLEEQSGWRILYNPPPGTKCDYWIVFSYGRPSDQMNCSRLNTAYLAGEPSSKKIYSRKFYGQFDKIFSSNRDEPHGKVMQVFPSLNWHVGLNLESGSYSYGYKELSLLKIPEKLDKISVICSNLDKTEGQKKRLKFLELAKNELGENLVHFGKGFQVITDKMDAILQFKYHLVLENDSIPFYWSEKLSDAFLGFAYPFYHGCTNINKLFDKHSLSILDINDPSKSIEVMKSAILNNLCWRKRKFSLRDLILNELNIFNQCISIAEKILFQLKFFMTAKLNLLNFSGNSLVIFFIF